MGEEKRIILESLLFRIQSVQNAENKKYVMMNVPNDNIQSIVNEIPGMRSPTVMPLAKPGWSSLHTVLDEKRFWEIIDKLKALGAEGILELPIEKMIP
jgi:ATP phosphoribosyltransferase